MKLKKIGQYITHSILVAAAEELGCTVHTLDHEFGYTNITNNGKTFIIFKASFSVNDNASSKFASNKFLSNKLLNNELDLFPESKLFYLPEAKKVGYQNIIEYIKQQQYNVVIKPLDLCGGKGIYVRPGNEANISEAINNIIQLGEEMVLVEKFIPFQQEYRLLSFNGEIIDVLQRIPAFVEGDGSSTIEALIAKKNEFRQGHGFKLINIDNNLIRLLESQELSLAAIPDNGKRVKLRAACNFGQGGEVIRIPLNTINPDYHAVVKKLHSLSQLSLIGTDLMTDNINLPPQRSVAMINEINSSPGMDIHYFADLQEGKGLATIKSLLSKIFE